MNAPIEPKLQLSAAPEPGLAPEATGENWAQKVITSVRGPALAGLLTLAVFVGGFGYWAFTAPLAGAAIAPGFVAAAGQNQRIQHLEGGILQELLVREGEKVVAGQPLMRLDRTDAEATRNRLTKALIAFRARAERLQAERDGLEDFSFSEVLVASARDSGLFRDLEEQRREFDKRRERYQTDALIIDQRIAALNEQIRGLEAQTSSARTQIEILDDEIEVKRKLLERKLTNRSEYLRLVRNRSELEGRIGGFLASIGEAKTSIVEAEQRKFRSTIEGGETAITALNDLRRQIADAEEQIRTAENRLVRIDVRAPSDGTIVNINSTTPGSVIRPGEDIMVLLPTGGELIIEARLSPLDVDVVTVGQKANLRFSALNSRVTPEVPAEVIYKSADRLMDPATNEPYFTTRLKIAEVLPDNINRNQIFPGMPVETYIETGNRTFFEYLLKPMLDSFGKAFREE